MAIISITITPDENCKQCHGTGTVYDTVDYGSTTAQMPSLCSCVDEQIPEGAEDADIVIVEKRED